VLDVPIDSGPRSVTNSSTNFTAISLDLFSLFAITTDFYFFSCYSRSGFFVANGEESILVHDDIPAEGISATSCTESTGTDLREQNRIVL
jgi:hypothetical protein